MEEKSDYHKDTRLCKDTVLRIGLLADTKVDWKQFKDSDFWASPKGEQSLCSPRGPWYITKTGSGSTPSCCFIAHAVPYAGNALTWWATVQPLQLSSCTPSSMNSFLNPQHSAERVKAILLQDIFSTVAINYNVFI